MRNEINFVDNDVAKRTHDWAEATPGYSGIQNDGKTREHHLHVFQRGQKSRLFTRGSGSSHGNGPSAVSVGGPFRNLGADTLIHRLRVTS